MSDLRGQLIRLAHAKPELRAQLLSVLTDKTAMEFPTQDAMDKYLDEHPGADKSIHKVVKTKPQPKGKPSEKEKARAPQEKAEAPQSRPRPKDTPGSAYLRDPALKSLFESAPTKDYDKEEGYSAPPIMKMVKQLQKEYAYPKVPHEKVQALLNTSETARDRAIDAYSAIRGSLVDKYTVADGNVDWDAFRADPERKAALEEMIKGQNVWRAVRSFASPEYQQIRPDKKPKAPAKSKVEKVKLPKPSTHAADAYEDSHPALKAIYKDAPTKVFGKNEGYSAPAIMKLVKQLHEKVNPIEASKLLDESEKTYHEALAAHSTGEKELKAAFEAANPRPDIKDPALGDWQSKFDKAPEMKPLWDSLAQAQNTWRAVRTWQEETKENLADVKAFKKTKPLHGGVKLSDAQLMQKFLQHAKPETKERMKGMSPHEFVQLLGAIMDDETGETGKTAGGTPAWAKDKKFTHPKTRNKVNFSSLPAEEQAKLRAKQKGKKKTLTPPKFGEIPEDQAELKAFKKSKPPRGRKLTDAQLMQKFLQHAKPSTKTRMKGVTPAEFVKMMGAIMDDEGGEGGKTASTNLRGQIIRLAHARPDLRADLLAVLQEPAKVAVKMKLAGKFPTGQTVMTSAVAAESRSNPAFAGFVARSLRRHTNGDWGEGDAGDRRMNDAALKSGDDRLFSVYKTGDATVWIITEWDRSVTTILFPSDY